VPRAGDSGLCVDPVVAATGEDAAEGGLGLYQTQPLAAPLASRVAANKQPLLEWYRDECAKGGKVAVGCSGSNYDLANAASIGARRMPASYSCCVGGVICRRTGWTNAFAICTGDEVVYGTVGSPCTDEHDAAQGEAVQLVCADPQ
jgi:hypothetical protein